MPRGDRVLEHVLRRLGFGADPSEVGRYAGRSIGSVIDTFLNYEQEADDVDTHIGSPDYIAVTTRGQFSPNTVINDARQRELFRMVHSTRPLQEKMALFWHNHFATAYSKIAGAVGQDRATRMMDNDPGSLDGSEPGQIQKLRQFGTGSFPNLLLTMAKDPAMIYWLDSQLNTRTRPQENFGREIMELFSMGIGNYTEADVYAAARVFTGFNWQIVGDRANNRIQIFDQEGKFLAQWTQFGRPSGIFFDTRDQIYVADSESDDVQNPGWEMGIRIGDARTGWISAFIQYPWGDPRETPGTGAEFVAVDRDGNLYGGEPRPKKLQKYVRVRP